MITLCPYCNKPLRVKLSGSFISEIDPNLKDFFLQINKRKKEVANKMGGFFGGMMSFGADISQSTGAVGFTAEMMTKLPPPLLILSCAECDRALDFHVLEEHK